MAVPNIPNGFYLNQGDAKVALQWDIAAGATSYAVQRSTDGVNFSTIASPVINQYLDISVTLGQIYYYQVASTNGSGSSPFANAISCVPTMGGEMSLGELQTQCRQRADRLNSQFVTMPEVNTYIMQSMYELYDILIDAYVDMYKAPAAIFYSQNNQQYYPMPNGVLQFYSDTGAVGNPGPLFTPAPIYKLLGLDLGLNTSNNGWATVEKYNYIDRNTYFYPNSNSTIYGVFNCRYRWMGNNLELIPYPSSNQPFRIQYIPRLAALLQPQDVTSTSISGWLEYVITDVAIKILQKEESDVTVLAAQKMMLTQRIQSAAQNRDAGQPDTISDVRGTNYWWRNGGSGSAGGGW